MKNKLVLTLTLLFLLFGSMPLQSQTSFVLEKDIVVAEGEEQENVIAFGGRVLIEGKVEEDVIAFGGSITIRGKVKGSVVGIGSTITLESTAVIEKDVYSLGGELIKEPGCVINGDTVYFKTSEDLTKFLKEVSRDIFTISFIPLILVTKLIIFFIWFILGIVIAAVLPRQVSFASTQIRKSFWSTFGIGILSIIIYIGAVIFSALLCFLLIGIPILFFLIIVGVVIQIFGRVVLFYFLGESLIRGFGKQKISPIAAVILGLVLATVIRFIPVIGSLFSLFLSIVGWGIVIRTKFGTTENWFRRK
jgi:cytoskeletal protein CcmA (bactofilin family)